MLSLRGKWIKKVAMSLATVMLVEIIFPTASYALTTGPSQPEVQGFEPVGTTEMVDLFTGDFNYNIPLFELPGPNGGYPFNLAYHSGVSMDQEASWVGLGWSLNAGAITRNMRGLPDDLNGGIVYKTTDMKPNVTVGGKVKGNFELFGANNLQVGISSGLNVYHNNYRGWGYGIEVGMGVSQQLNDGVSGYAGLNLSLDSQEGLGFSPYLSLSKSKKDGDQSYTGSASLGFNYNSRMGLSDMTLGVSTSSSLGSWKQTRMHNGKEQTRSGSIGTSGAGSSAGFSFAQTPYIPSVSQNYKGKYIDIIGKLGGAGFGAFANGSIGGYYSDQKLQNAGKRTGNSAYGYLYQHNANSNGLADFNREKEGPIHRNSPNLPIPSMTFDVYSIAGQGTGGQFRPYRNDVPILSDQENRTVLSSLSFGLDIGIGAGFHLGGNASLSHASSRSGKWTNGNPITNIYGQGSTEADYERYYFKRPGELTAKPLDYLSHIKGYDPVRVDIEKSGLTCNATTKIEYPNGTSYGKMPASQAAQTERNPRNMGIMNYSNGDIWKGGNEVLPEFDIKYYGSGDLNSYGSAPSNGLTRNSRNTSDIAGFESINPNGTRYVYALPAYNNKHEEYVFSVGSTTFDKKVDVPGSGSNVSYKINGTDEYLDKTELPAYAHSYMLTSVLGTDYADVDGTPGPSDEDFGYWVKFNYVKTSDAYKWRAPFTQANYMPGMLTTIQDDKGSFMYGEREMWYLATVETKTHIAEFVISSRTDAKDANGIIQNSASTGSANSYKLDTIKLFSKEDRSVPVQTVVFEYDYSLCNGVQNGSTGKLTLTGLYMTYQNNTRGSLNKYSFTYSASNPDYEEGRVDRWGSYNGKTSIENLSFPYLDQFETRAVIDENAESWHLTEIGLPSGATIDIDYESDDYAYVQNRRAMQMFKIKGMDSNGSNSFDSKNSNRYVYFNLETPVSSSLNTAEQDSVLNEYFDGIDQLYFKTKIHVKQSGKPQYQEYLSGYVDITDYRMDPGSVSGGNFTRGIVVLGNMKNGNKSINYHPFSVAAWQHLRTNDPRLLTSDYQITPITPNSSTSDKVSAMLMVLNPAFMWNNVRKVFQGIYPYCSSKDFGEKIDLDQSWIRLNSPDKIKYGGGVRVKSITMNDSWAVSASGESSSDYGQVFEYTTTENGKIISSGVAAYEPMIGGDENPFRTAKQYTQSLPLATNNQLFFEYPVNESYYPSPIVGYSKVTVKSLATDKLIKGQFGSKKPTTTGATIHQFYTAKDFPVIAKETAPDIIPNTKKIPIPLVGVNKINNLAASQGYMIELNDMHGKPYMVENYKQDTDGNIIWEAPISSVKYTYSFENKVDSKYGPYKQLKNDVFTIAYDVDQNNLSRSKIERKYLGVDYDFFTDMRRTVRETTKGGFSLNTEGIWIIVAIVPVPVPWPTTSYTKEDIRIAVTNKVIHKSGILTKVEAIEDGSKVVTENKLFDQLTGRPLLTVVNNDYEDPIYNYSYPGYWAYDQMGPAYKTIGIRVSSVTFSTTGINDVYSVNGLGNAADKLVPGDEFIFSGSTNGIAYFLGKHDGDYHFNVTNSVGTSGQNYSLLLTRSGNRNMLNSDIQQISALSDPTMDRDMTECYRDLVAPDNVKDTLVVDTVPSPCAIELVELLDQQLPVSQEVFFYQVPQLVYGCDQWCEDDVKIDSTKIHFGNYHINHTIDFCCIYQLYDSTGSPIHFSQIDSIFNASIEYGSALTIPLNDFSGYKFTVRDKNTQSNYTAYLYSQSGYGSSCELDYSYVYNSQITDSTGTYLLKDTLFIIHDVLYASATPYSDTWPQDFNNVRFESSVLTKLSDLQNFSMYQSGEKGVWKPTSGYVYVDERLQSSTLDTRVDGTMGDIPMFNFHGLTGTACAGNWRLQKEITRYNPYGFEIENRDILDIYSGALYGWGGRLPVAVGANAKYNEIGFESFEEYQEGGTVDQYTVSSGNIDIYNSYTTPGGSDPYRIYLWQQGIAGRRDTTIVDVPYPTEFASYDDVKIGAKSEGSVFNKPYSFAGLGDASAQPYSQNPDWAGYEFTIAPDFHTKPDDAIWVGKVWIPQVNKFKTSNFSNIAFSSTKAHTGRISLKLYGSHTFPQNRFRPEDGKEYVISLWLSKTNTHVPTFKSTNAAYPLGVQVEFLDKSDVLISSSPIFEPAGEIIEGWQKVEGAFTVPSLTNKIQIVFKNGDAAIDADFTTYFDDIRIFPHQGEIQTYVYSPEDFRLQAVLDRNNFATIYHYDSEGKLFLVKKETSEGIMTIQESKSFAKE